MYINIVFILYIAALLTSVVCLVFIALVFVQGSDRKNRTYIAVRRFSVTVTLVDLLYFVFYYREVVRQQYELALPFRIVDYTLCCLLFLFWILLAEQLVDKRKNRRMKKTAIAITVARLVLSLFVTTIFMGEYYNIDDPQARHVWMVAETSFVLLLTLIAIYYVIYGVIKSSTKSRRKYILLCSLLIIIWLMEQWVVGMGLAASKYGVSAWMMGVPDLKGLLLVLMNIATCALVFREDFSPIFFISGHDNTDKVGNLHTILEDSNAEDEFIHDDILCFKLDMVAQDHGLTVREREVLKLLYSGMTNPQIAGELYISVNTVKKHVKNIYEKMDVKSRLEIIHMVNLHKQIENVKEQ